MLFSFILLTPKGGIQYRSQKPPVTTHPVNVPKAIDFRWDYQLVSSLYFEHFRSCEISNQFIGKRARIICRDSRDTSVIRGGLTSHFEASYSFTYPKMTKGTSQTDASQRTVDAALQRIVWGCEKLTVLPLAQPLTTKDSSHYIHSVISCYLPWRITFEPYLAKQLFVSVPTMELWYTY